MDRRCGRCDQVKSVEEFAWRRKDRGQRDNYCRPCRAAYKKEHYARNRARYIKSAQDRKRAVVAERMAYLIDFFRAHPCVDCGESDPLVLEFDHLGEKEFNISRGIRDRRWQSAGDAFWHLDCFPSRGRGVTVALEPSKLSVPVRVRSPASGRGAVW